jgi:hypothetical protein
MTVVLFVLKLFVARRGTSPPPSGVPWAYTRMLVWPKRCHIHLKLGDDVVWVGGPQDVSMVMKPCFVGRIMLWPLSKW